ncbi:ABC transporter permease [Olivibacter domesticus]|uniref:ABC-type antimicrobial peptide transport system, permease component n=1 Tax=Olivibacter domesticus TaxID=407022 RepID=A0A1H7SDI0_OLID1|nr:ABC transporter permease [Olivibacter domesticus]SEL70692.1 ABC-type antimicrobial peptide transport system, permease component [Olivibacter domesticus]
MLKNYFKIAWRNLQKHKFHTFINVVGLACGLSFALAIGAYIWQESTFDSQLKNVNNQYVLQSEWKSPEMGMPITTLGALPKALKEEYPDLVRNYYRFDGITCVLSYGDQTFNEEAALGDSTLLSMYGLPLLYGNAATALKDPFSLVITNDIALKYFGKTDVLGQQVNVKNFTGETHPFTVTAVLDKLPKNSVTNLNESLNNKVFLSSEAVDFFKRNLDSWQNAFIVGYVELQAGISPEMLKQPMKDLLVKHTDEKVVNNLIPTLNPLSNYHLKKDNGLIEKMLFTLGCIAGFILLMAVVNFINLSINGSTSRLKEIGVRKVMGSSRKQLGFQFIGESVLMVCLAFFIAVLLYPFISPAFSAILGQELPKIYTFSYSIWLYIFLACLAIGLSAGLYPAFRLSALKTINSVKGKIPHNLGNTSFLRSLVGFQFVVALSVIMAAGIISRQVSLFFSNNLGYDKESLITVKVPRDWSETGLSHMKAVQQALKDLPQIENISLSYDTPGGQGQMATGVLNFAQDTGNEQPSVSAQYILADTSFAATYKIPMLAGKFLDDKINQDLAKVVISEKASQLLGFKNPNDALNQQVYLKPNDFPATIVGVTKDFYAASMRDAQTPVIWTNIKADNLFRYFSIRLNAGNLGQHLASIEKEWKKLLPNTPFEYQFMDESIDALYKTELQLKNAAYTATILSSLIVFLGIVGLVSLNVQKRRKEIGVRKVLGSTVNGIISLFMKDLLITFIVAIVIACPLVYLFISKWLQSYSIQITLTPLFFILPILLLASVAAAIIGLQTVKAAKSNPVDSLRDE